MGIHRACDRGNYALAGNELRYMEGWLTFAPGETEQEGEVFLNQDNYREGDEIFLVKLSQPQGGVHRRWRGNHDHHRR